MTKRTNDMTPNQRRQLIAALQVDLIINPDGTVNYRPGASDATMCRRFGLSDWQVKSERRRNFGNMALEGSTNGRVPPQVRLWDRLNSLEAEIQRLNALLDQHILDDERHYGILK